MSTLDSEYSCIDYRLALRLAQFRQDQTRRRSINWTAERVPADAVLLCDELDMLNHLQFASAYRLYDFRLFRAEQLTDLVDNNELNSLQRARKEYLRDRSATCDCRPPHAARWERCK